MEHRFNSYTNKLHHERTNDREFPISNPRQNQDFISQKDTPKAKLKKEFRKSKKGKAISATKGKRKRNKNKFSRVNSQSYISRPGFSNKFFVGGFSTRVTIQELREYFSQYGVVTKIQLVTDQYTGISKGYGFVSCGSDRMARTIKNQKVHILGGRKMDIGEASNDSSKRQEFIEKNRKKKIYISDIGPEVSDDDLEDCFRQFGYVNKAYTISDASNPGATRFGFVVFNQEYSANLAI
jgi:RNA recognition motif-containing protein